MQRYVKKKTVKICISAIETLKEPGNADRSIPKVSSFIVLLVGTLLKYYNKVIF